MCGAALVATPGPGRSQRSGDHRPGRTTTPRHLRRQGRLDANAPDTSVEPRPTRHETPGRNTAVATGPSRLPATRLVPRRSPDTRRVARSPEAWVEVRPHSRRAAATQCHSRRARRRPSAAGDPRTHGPRPRSTTPGADRHRGAVSSRPQDQATRERRLLLGEPSRGGRVGSRAEQLRVAGWWWLSLSQKGAVSQVV